MGSLNQHITPTGYRLGGTPVNSNPFWEDGGGNTKNITATASVDNTTGTPAVEVTKTETTEAVNFDFAFTGLKGAQGEKGDDGATPEVSASAVVTDVGSTPSVSVTNVGTTEAPNFQFTFDHIGGGGESGPATTLKKISGGGFGSALQQLVKSIVTDMYEASGIPSLESWFNTYTGTVTVPFYTTANAGGDGFTPHNLGLTSGGITEDCVICPIGDTEILFANPSDVASAAPSYELNADSAYGMVDIRKSSTGMNFVVGISIKCPLSAVGYGNLASASSVLKITLTGNFVLRVMIPNVFTIGTPTNVEFNGIDFNCAMVRTMYTSEHGISLYTAGHEEFDVSLNLNDYQYFTDLDDFEGDDVSPRFSWGDISYIKPTSDNI